MGIERSFGGGWDVYLARSETGEVDQVLWSRKSRAGQHGASTIRQRALWENVQRAKLQGLSLRAIARDLGIHRNTARRYALADSLRLRRISDASPVEQPGVLTFAQTYILQDNWADIVAEHQHRSEPDHGPSSETELDETDPHQHNLGVGSGTRPYRLWL